MELDNFHFFTGTAFRQQIFYRNGVPDRSGLLSPLLIVVAFDDACHVRHAAVAEFDVKFVANFVEAVVWGKCLLMR